MQFDSLTFIVFFLLVASLHALLRNWNTRKNMLLVASYVFYAAWNPLFLPLLVTTSFLDWRMARQMAACRNPRHRKWWLWAILIINLGVLGYFKYAWFLTDSFSQVLNWLGMELAVEPFSVILPIGISFYTFHSLSYCIDVYRRQFEPVHNLRDYLLYVAFFPQLVAGPIVRWTEMREQIEQPRHMGMATTGMGLALMVVGLFEKVVLADAVFGPVADAYFNEGTVSGGDQAWVGALAFSGQIFCDFAGYTTCALGAALVLGFRLPINFLNPYAALGFSDFWRRWHISLSTWLRDYVYIGLGGNRRGRWFTYRNLMLTMLLGGLWHGAAWTFVVWGGIHGALLVCERLLTRWHFQPGLLGRALGRLATFAVIVVTWVWFRSPDMTSAWQTTSQMLAVHQWGGAGVMLSGAQKLVLLTMGLLVAGQWAFDRRTLPEVLARIPAPLLGLLLGGLLALIVLTPGESNAFIYFQF